MLYAKRREETLNEATIKVLNSRKEMLFYNDRLNVHLATAPKVVKTSQKLLLISYLHVFKPISHDSLILV